MRQLQIALIGDYDPTVTAHQAIPQALALSAERARADVRGRWIHSAELSSLAPLSVDGVWCVPASPYADTATVLGAIGSAREAGTPFLGTCGGFQHAVLEAASALWGLAAPAHAELDAAAADPVIAPLSCSLVEVSGTVRLAPGSRLAGAYGRLEAEEQYHCRYGLSPKYAARLEAGPLRATAWGSANEVRAVELDGHPFFVATLFQPERKALAGCAPPLITAFVRAMVARVAG